MPNWDKVEEHTWFTILSGLKTFLFSWHTIFLIVSLVDAFIQKNTVLRQHSIIGQHVNVLM